MFVPNFGLTHLSFHLLRAAFLFSQRAGPLGGDRNNTERRRLLLHSAAGTFLSCEAAMSSLCAPAASWQLQSAFILHGTVKDHAASRQSRSPQPAASRAN
jgi:hypothetical protein